MPTFLVLSGTGLHIYYVFQQPIDRYPNIKIQLKSLKYDRTFRLWEYGSTSQVKAIQYQSINQGFRMVGSINDKPVSYTHRDVYKRQRTSMGRSWSLSVPENG